MANSLDIPIVNLLSTTMDMGHNVPVNGARLPHSSAIAWPLSVPVLPLSMQQSNGVFPEGTRSIHDLTPALSVPATQSENFNPADVDISDAKFLQKLKRKQLCELCFHHRVSAGGTNEAIITRLLHCKILPSFNTPI